ncbi:hypothetical protein E6C64_03640 [Naasia lichenicola]|uniref:Uncharacterized protein n=2 Tax=Naasia lichenicola TaxID=2565933 RepID=A0A4S4FRZ6_9MICO|nr:hypothetical protein E6C64_03640 [Naasia lichenicola]
MSDSSSMPSGWGREFMKALSDQHFAARNVEKAFVAGVKAVTQGSSDRTFQRLQAAMLDALVEILRVDPNRVDYLKPIVTAKDLVGIATLNYDRSLELACDAAEVTHDTGFSAWRGGYDWNWNGIRDVRLLKVHGSLDWTMSSLQRDGMRVRGDSLSQLGESANASNAVNGQPAVVFGHGSKLRADGPFLAMLVELDRMLATTEWLTIIGYSYRDDHINAAIARWLNSSVASRLTMIDKNERTWEFVSYPPTFAREVLSGIKGGEQLGQKKRPPLTHDVIVESAAVGLSQIAAELAT